MHESCLSVPAGAATSKATESGGGKPAESIVVAPSTSTGVLTSPSKTALVNAAAQAQAERARRALEELEKVPLAIELQKPDVAGDAGEPSTAAAGALPEGSSISPPAADVPVTADEIAAQGLGPPDPHKVTCIRPHEGAASN